MSKPLVLWLGDRKKVLVFRSQKYGVIRLRKFLSTNDFIVLIGHLKNNEIDLKEFTIKVLNDVVLVTPEENLQNWEDSALISIARKWAKRAIPEDIDERGIKNFEDFKIAVSKHINRMLKMTGETVKLIGESMNGIGVVLASQIADMRSQISFLFNEITRAFTGTKLIQGILDQAISDFQKSLLSILESAENADNLRKILESSGYELAPLIIHSHDLLDLKDKNFEPTITNRIFNLTKNDDLIVEVESAFVSPQLKKRVPALKQALIAHQSRQFYLSTPVFIAQTDGIFTDWLILLKLVRRQKGIVVACEKEKTDKMKKLISLGARVEHAKENLDTDGLLKIAIDNVLTRSIGKRNSVLHGESSNYGTAKNSTQALLMVLFFADVLESAIKNKKET